MFRNSITCTDKPRNPLPPLKLSFKDVPIDMPTPDRNPYGLLPDTLSGKNLDRCIFYCLQFYVIYEPDKIRALCGDLKEKMQDVDIDSAPVHIDGDEGLLLTQTEMLYGYLTRTHRKKDLQKILDYFHNQAFLKETVASLKNCSPEQAYRAERKALSDGDGTCFFYPVFAFLAMYINNIPCRMANRFFMVEPEENAETEMADAAKHYHMDSCFSESRAVQKWTEKFHNQLNTYAQEEFLSASIEECLLSQLAGCPSGFNGRTGYAGRTDMKFLSAARYIASSCCGIGADPLDENQLELSRNIVSDVIKAHILSCYEEDYSNRICQRNNEALTRISVPGNKDSEPFSVPDKDEGLTEWSANNVLRQTDIAGLFTSCLIALTAMLFYNHASPSVRFTAASLIQKEGEPELTPASVSSRYEDEMQKLRLENAKLAEKLKSTKEAVDAEPYSKAAFVSLSLKCEELSSALNKSRDEAAILRKELRDQDRKIEKLNSELEEQGYEIEALKEQKASAYARKKETRKEADPDGKYLFIVTDDRMIKKLGQWFPNSCCSEGMKLTKHNAKTFDLAVCMTGLIPHREYYRVKNRCTSLNIPLIHCNSCNYRTILETIAEGMGDD